jgi:hypothetical protein
MMRKISVAAILSVAALTTPMAMADDAKTAPPAAWSDTLKLYGHLEAGITGNTDDPSNDINFGHLFTDRSNTPLLNQLLVTLERPADSKATGYDFGFRLQGMYGTDSRFTHFLGELDRVTRDWEQVDIVEANLQAHLPWLTDGGVDVKIGQYVTLEGAEVIDATGNFFYSHTYIFNFGIPFKHTGLMITTHLNPTVDLYTGVDSGVNTSLGGGDNNDAGAFHGGIGLNLGAVTILATTHIGPENPEGTPGVRANSDLRYLNDMVVLWKISDALTSTTDLNYIRDDGFDVEGGGIAQYLTYTVNDWVSVGGRVEFWRDENGFFVGAFPGTFGFVNVEKGKPDIVIGGGNTTYGAFTFGLNLKPPVPKVIDGFLIRPEIRYDRSFSNTKPFDAGTDKDQFTIAADFILPFSVF